jgi:hypothetical protein
MSFPVRSEVRCVSHLLGVLGHSRAEIYERNYQSKDVQSAYSETPEHDTLIRALGNMSLTRDPTAPKNLSPEQIDAVERDPKSCDQPRCLARLMERNLVPFRKRGYSQLGNSIKHLRRTLQQEAFRVAREEYFETILKTTSGIIGCGRV